MKTTLISLLTAALLGLAASASGRLFDAADFIAVAFVAVLVAWTFAQYNSTPQGLRKNSPIHLPIKPVALPLTLQSDRRVA